MHDNLLNNDICPSSLGENDEPITEGETAHKWDYTESPVSCAECGAGKDEDITELNIVTCGDCGRVFAHELTVKEDLNCPYCPFSGDISSFPDFYYTPDWQDSIISIKK